MHTSNQEVQMSITSEYKIQNKIQVPVYPVILTLINLFRIKLVL